MHTPYLDKLSAEDRMFHQKLIRRLAMLYGAFALVLMLWVVVGPSLRPAEEAKAPARDLTATAVNQRFAR
jgi:hypothetical protein